MISALVSLTLISQQITRAMGTAPSLGCCITDCHGRPNGDYQSCYGCEYYATCAGGEMTSPVPTISFWDRRPCGAAGIGLEWDDNSKRCEWDSSTCDPENGVCNEMCESNLPEPFPAECGHICEIADFLIILDGSGSISGSHFNASLNWLKDILASNIPDTADVALLQFSHRTQWIHHFSDTQQPRTDMIDNIDSTSQTGGGTDIGLALQVGIYFLNLQSATEKILILLTDGESSDPCLRNNPIPADISIFVVGLDGADPSSQLGCLDPPAVDIVTIVDFDYTVVTDTLVACEAICDHD